MKDNALILLLALAGVGGLLWWTTQAQAQAKTQPQPEPSPAESGSGLGFSVGGTLGRIPGHNPLPPVQPFDPDRGFGVRIGLGDYPSFGGLR